jgi:hypothetical protein
MFQSAETLPTFIKRKHPRKGEEKEKKSRASKRREPQGGK